VAGRSSAEASARFRLGDRRALDVGLASLATLGTRANGLAAGGQLAFEQRLGATAAMRARVGWLGADVAAPRHPRWMVVPGLSLALGRIGLDVEAELAPMRGGGGTERAFFVALRFGGEAGQSLAILHLAILRLVGHAVAGVARHGFEGSSDGE